MAQPAFLKNLNSRLLIRLDRIQPSRLSGSIKLRLKPQSPLDMSQSPLDASQSPYDASQSPYDASQSPYDASQSPHDAYSITKSP